MVTYMFKSCVLCLVYLKNITHILVYTIIIKSILGEMSKSNYNQTRPLMFCSVVDVGGYVNILSGYLVNHVSG